MILDSTITFLQKCSLSLLWVGALSAGNPTLVYGKLDVGTQVTAPVPSIGGGVGVRHRPNHYGYDMSIQGKYLASKTEVYEEAWSIEGKAHFLYYPEPCSKNTYYFGLGPGINYLNTQRKPLPGIESETLNVASLTACGLIGWEFQRDKNWVPFIQIELTQPLFRITSENFSEYWIPSLSFTFGCGF